MAGFFGMFNYNKEGPGVDKNRPQKKAFFAFFEIYFRKFWKLCIANLLYVLVNLPIVTNGLAEAGLTYITRSYTRERHAFLPSDFFDAIRRNWKQALVAGLIKVVLSVMLFYNIFFFAQMTDPTFGMIGLGATLCVLAVLSFTYYYVYFLIVTFKLKLKQIFKNGLLLTSVSIGRCFLITGVLLICYAIAYVLFTSAGPFGWLVALILYLLVFPSFRSMLIQFAIFQPIYKWMVEPYYQEHPDEDVELRLSLGLTVESEQEDEQVFTDRGARKAEAEEKVPHQYSEKEMRSFRAHVADTEDDQI